MAQIVFCWALRRMMREPGSVLVCRTLRRFRRRPARIPLVAVDAIVSTAFYMLGINGQSTYNRGPANTQLVSLLRVEVPKQEPVI